MRYNVRFIPEDCECGFAHLTLQADKSIKVQNCCRRIQTDENTRCAIGKALVSFPDADPLEGRLNVSFYGQRKSIL
jgi:apolipoprotein D and lipocalin family protein